MTIKDLEKKRSTVTKRLTKIQFTIVNWDPATVNINELELISVDLKDMKEKLEDLYNETSEICSDAEFVPHDADFTTLFNGLKTLQVKVMDIQKAREISAKASPSFKLERIKLPQFSGEFSDWQSFCDLFKSSVHNNPSLTGAEKMVHLKSCLTGSAASIVSSFSTTDASYKEAWESVFKRYSNPREIIFAHLKKFDEVKGLQSETASGLRSISDSLNECTRSLKVLKVPVEHWDLILIYYSSKKLDQETRKEWLLEQKTNLPTIQEFVEFLESRARALADSSMSIKAKTSPMVLEKRKATHAHHTAQPVLECAKCSEPHQLHQCKVFGNLTMIEKKDLVAKAHLCFNCLHKGHSALQCRMKFSCRKCGKRHHTLLHVESQPSVPSQIISTARPSSQQLPLPSLAADPIDEPVVGVCTPQQYEPTVVLMGTLVVTADDATGEKMNCRVFVDSGSESHFISERCTDMLGLQRKATCVGISGIGGAKGESARGIVNLRLFSRTQDFSMKITALVLRKITNLLPRAHCKSSWPHLKNLDLADPYFNQPGPIDILLGAKRSGAIVLPEIIHGPVGAPTAQNTVFGWMLSGEVNQVSSSSKPRQTFSHHVSCHGEEECLESSLERFWVLEEAEPRELAPSEEDIECESHFVRTHVRNQNGSYTVELPFRKDAPPLGNSRDSAVKRLHRIEHRLSKDPELKEVYGEAINQYIQAKFMEPVPPEELAKEDFECYYMPHHVVVKPSSTSTKYRIVYDASAKASNGVALNDVLMTGPKISSDLFPILVRFRTHRIAMSADIYKFYPQYTLKKSQTDFQRLVWRENRDQPIQDFRMLRLTFGITCAPYLAIRCLHQLAEDEKNSFPNVVDVLKQDFLIDNLLSGSPDVQSGLVKQSEILQVMSRGNLKLTKWMSNSLELLSAVPPDHRDGKESRQIQDGEAVKTIGVLWFPRSDTFGVSIVIPDLTQGSSKRKVLSSVARIFDPLGWLSPVTIKQKMLMQQLWKAKLDWDSPLPAALHQSWLSYCQELKILENFRIDRCIASSPTRSDEDLKFELHGFCDASPLAYSAVVYIRTINPERESAVKLVAAKSKVAPVKVETIPRLELCGAVLLCKLMKEIKKAVQVEFEIIRCWTDSTIVIDWICGKKKLPVFESNRVRKIHKAFPSYHWYHVPGDENPADAPSRGISASSLIMHPLWFRGPAWLTSTEFQVDKISNVSTTIVESELSFFIRNCSSFSRMKRVVAYCIRFICNAKALKPSRKVGKLSVEELNQALVQITKCVQSEAFPEEIKRCQEKLLVKTSIKFLAPFLDNDKILRVGGRLQQSTLSYGRKHPILLPRKHNFTNQVVKYFHVISQHAPPQLVLSLIREQFWIVGGLNLVKQLIGRCVVCHRLNAVSSKQIMGQLPSPRVLPSRPFSQCGLDYAGPFMLCLRTGRNPPVIKSYVSLFVCMATTAIHLELVSDLSTPTFIGALTRFISRRGRPSDIFCDGGKNFVGANNEILEFQKVIHSSAHQDKVVDFSAENGIKFHFNPPQSPHHGGPWEAGVKSMKIHLKRVMGERKLSTEEFSTLLSQVESSLNSRPLTQMSSDPNDLSALTPGHFLIGDSLKALPQPDLTPININRLSRWQIVQQMHQHFWRRWQAEYLCKLQSRPKWFAPQDNMNIGTLVLILDDDPQWGCLKWKLGRISAVFPGPDGKVRVCEVKTNKGVYKRPIVKLSPLPIYGDK